MARASKDPHEAELDGRVDGDDRSREESRDGDTVGDLFDDGSGRSESGRGDVHAAVEPHDGGDDYIDNHRQPLSAEHGLVILSRVSHLGDDREPSSGSTIGL